MPFRDFDDSLANEIHSLLDLTKSAKDLVPQIKNMLEHLELDSPWGRRLLFEMRIEIISHLLTRGSLAKENNRLELARHYHSEHGICEEVSQNLSDRIFGLYDKWQVERESPSERQINHLMKIHKRICQHCKHNLIDSDSDSFDMGVMDFFKPYFWKDYRRELCPEIDHVIPVSQFGTNRESNFQLLCRFCNQGKKDGLLQNYISSLKKYSFEFENRKKPPSEILPLLRALAYYRIEADDGMCTDCGDSEKPLTIRKIDERLLPTMTNTQTLCYDCVNKKE